MLHVVTGDFPQKRAFSSSDEYKALLHLSGFKGVSLDCANASHIREKQQQNEVDQNENS